MITPSSLGIEDTVTGKSFPLSFSTCKYLDFIFILFTLVIREENFLFEKNEYWGAFKHLSRYLI